MGRLPTPSHKRLSRSRHRPPHSRSAFPRGRPAGRYARDQTLRRHRRCIYFQMEQQLFPAAEWI